MMKILTALLFFIVVLPTTTLAVINASVTPITGTSCTRIVNGVAVGDKNCDGQAAVVVPPPDPQPPVSTPTSIISIGHSLLGHPHMPAAINALAADAGVTITANKTQNNPGASLDYNYNNPQTSHVDNYLVELAANTFDVFIITEAMAIQSNVYAYGTTHAQLFYDAAIANNTAVEFYVWQTWDCRANLGTGNCNDARAANGLVGQIILDRPSWYQIADEVSAAKNNATINIIPGGEAMIAVDAAITAGQIDGVTNIDQLFSDDIHLNVNGWYYMALVQYATIYKSSPVGLTSNVPAQPNTLSAAAVATMQQLAWDTVCNFERSGVSCTPPVATAEPGCALDRQNAMAAKASNPYSYTGSLDMGNNLAAFAYWESAYPFADLRRQSDQENRDLGSWNLSAGATGGVIDSNRNVVALTTGSVNKGLILDAHCLYGGDYVVLWNQTNSPAVSLTHFGAGTLELTTDDAANGRRVYTLTIPENTTINQYKATNLSVVIDSPITGNVDYHVLLPGTESSFLAGNLFNPDYIEEVENNDVARFMDWLAVNNSTISTVAELPSMDSDTWARNMGIPYGVTMKLVKEAGIPKAWINIHHQATDAAITEIANQIYAEWQAGIAVYVEFSNEIWNHGFTQTAYAEAQGAIMFPGLTGLNAQSTWLAQRSVDTKNIFQTVFGTDQHAIKLVVGGHIQTNGYVDTTNLDNCYENCRLTNQYNDIENAMDVYAIGPYISGAMQGAIFADANNVASWTDAQIYAHLNHHTPDPDDDVSTDIQSIIAQMTANRTKVDALTSRNDIELAVYEFGQHVSAHHDPNTPLDTRYAQFQSTTQMGTLYYDLIQAMIDAGVVTAASFDDLGEHSVGYYWGGREGIAGPYRLRTLAVEAAY